MSIEFSSPAQVSRLAAFVHRETLQLFVLAVSALVAFAVTRGMEHRLSGLRAHDEQAWFERGQHAMAAGDATVAVAAYERANATARGNVRYALALSQARAATGDVNGSRELLLRLRESAPDNPDINLPLARLAMARHDVSEAVRFFNAALYAPTAPSEDPAHPALRLELARFLVAHDQKARAISELSVAAERPIDDERRVEMANLLRTAGDSGKALEQYLMVLQHDDANAAARRSAGDLLLTAGDYAGARDVLTPLVASDTTARESVEVATRVLEGDPLAARLAATERWRRLRGGVDALAAQLAGCAEYASGVAGHEPVTLATLRHAVGRVSPSGAMTVTETSDALDQAVGWAASRCGTATPQDRALQLIAAKHEARS